MANFEVYCEKDPIIEEEICRPWGEVWLAYNVVLQLVSSYEGKGYMIIMDNFFLAFHYSRNYWRAGPMCDGPRPYSIARPDTRLQLT